MYTDVAITHGALYGLGNFEASMTQMEPFFLESLEPSCNNLHIFMQAACITAVFLACICELSVFRGLWVECKLVHRFAYVFVNEISTGIGLCKASLLLLRVLFLAFGSFERDLDKQKEEEEGQ